MATLELDDDNLTLGAPMLRRLYADWQSLRHNNLIPRRADFDPMSLRYALGKLSLIEVSRDPLRFKTRVHGTGLAQHLGYEFTGKFLDEAPDTKYYRLVNAHFTDVVTHRRPSFGRLTSETQHPPVLENEALVLPLSHDGERVDFLLSAVVHHRHFSLAAIDLPRIRVVALQD